METSTSIAPATPPPTSYSAVASTPSKRRRLRKSSMSHRLWLRTRWHYDFEEGLKANLQEGSDAFSRSLPVATVDCAVQVEQQQPPEFPPESVMQLLERCAEQTAAATARKFMAEIESLKSAYSSAQQEVATLSRNVEMQERVICELQRQVEISGHFEVDSSTESVSEFHALESEEDFLVAFKTWQAGTKSFLVVENWDDMLEKCGLRQPGSCDDRPVREISSSMGKLGKFVDRIDVDILRECAPRDMYAGLDTVNVIALWVRFPKLARAHWKENWRLCFCDFKLKNPPQKLEAIWTNAPEHRYDDHCADLIEAMDW